MIGHILSSIKLLFCITILFLSSVGANAQGWENVGGGLDDNVYDMIKYDGELFVGGRFLYKAKSWNGTNWTTYNGLYGIAFPLTFTIYEDTLYAGGDFPYSGSESKVYRLVSGTWEEVGGIFDELQWSSTKKLITYDTLIISGGRFTSINGNLINNIGAWDGNSWSPMGDGLNDIVLNLGIHENVLYATGEFTASGSNTSVQSIARWTGSNWECFDSAVVFNSAYALKSYQGNLLIGNVWDTIAGIPMKGIANWDGTNYTSMGDTIIKNVHEFWDFNGELFIAADLNGVDPWITDRAVLKWTGNGWIQIGGQFNEWIMCLEDYDNMLFCGGQYSSPTSHIARFNPTLSINEFHNEGSKQLIKVVDLLGRETTLKPNTLLFYIYSDGSIKKVIIID